MPLGTLDRTPPPFFKQGLSAVSKLLLFSALAVLLMVADVRFQVTEPLRAALGVVLYPAQWLAQRPQVLARASTELLQSRDAAQTAERQATEQLLRQAQRAGQVEQLLLENQQLRELLGLRERLGGRATAAQVLYEAADPFTRKVIIDKGSATGVQAGQPVIDDAGVLGQITRVFSHQSEVTLLTDKNQTVPIQNLRTGLRGVAYGGQEGGMLELRFVAANADVQAGDELATSGIDGIYPAGLPVAKVLKVERNSSYAFARIIC